MCPGAGFFLVCHIDLGAVFEEQFQGHWRNSQVIQQHHLYTIHNVELEDSSAMT